MKRRTAVSTISHATACAALGVCVLFGQGAPARAGENEARTDSVAKLVRTLRTSGSYKVRLHAAALLVRFKDRRRDHRTDHRAVEALARAAVKDPQPEVRALAVRLLVESGPNSPHAKSPAGPRPNVAPGLVSKAIAAALDDRDDQVRAAARHAAKLFRHQQRKAQTGSRESGARTTADPSRPLPALGVSLGQIGGRAQRLFKDHLRTSLQKRLRLSPQTVVQTPGSRDVTFVIDGAVKELSTKQRDRTLAAKAVVELMVSRPPRGLAVLVSGESTVERTGRNLSGSARDLLLKEAVAQAVRSAHESLQTFFDTQQRAAAAAPKAPSLTARIRPAR